MGDHQFNMDTSWIRDAKFSKSYVDGVKSFMQFVRTHIGPACDVRCPCKNCLNLRLKDQTTVTHHILENGIDTGYITWLYHGEPRLNDERIRTDSDSKEKYNDEEDDGVSEMLFDLGEQYTQENNDNMPTDGNNVGGLPAYLEALMTGTQIELYPSCKKISKTSFIIQFLHLKVYNKLSNRAVDMMLSLMKSAFPDGETLPSTCYGAKKYLRDLGLGYECIHECKYDCVLFWNEKKKLEACPTCGTSRWKVNSGIGKKIPHKILRYFPVKPRLQRLFMSSKTSKKMVWHKQKCMDDDYMRHPADSTAWKDFDSEFTQFYNDPRNIRLALAADGFNPFGNLSTTHSMWPVILARLNLPPWDCMKRSFLMLSLLIPGKKSPGKYIDVYLQPLVKELTELWVEGSVTFDVSCKQNFWMHAAVLWTINDFPSYGDLTGWVTKRYIACPICNEQTCSQGLRNKLCFMGHRRNLSKHHPWRRSKKFNGKKEDGEPPRELSVDVVLLQLERLPEKTPGKYCNKKRKRMAEELNWSKRSIFFDLPYWSKLKLRHNLDSVKFPASNISRCVGINDQKISGQKSHDGHILLQQILPVGIRGSLDKNISNVLAELGHFFQRLCYKKLKRLDLPKMGEDINLILCKLEQIYPPDFFDGISLCELKQSVRNKAHLEGSVAEAYIVSKKFRHLGAAKYVQLSENEFKDMQWFVFQDCEEIEPFLEKHKQELMLEGSTNIDQDHKEKFPPWFKNVMNHSYNASPSDVNESLYSLACAPNRLVTKYTGYIVNGVRFLTIERDVRRKTQNSGIVVEGNHGDDNIKFFGILTDIIHLDYVNGRHYCIQV
ncbi:hypothetical protein OROMI_021815 [Orobanche minor]